MLCFHRCLSVHRWGVCQTPPQTLPLGTDTPRQTPPFGRHPWGRHPPGKTPPCPVHAEIQTPCPVYAGIHPLPNACWDTAPLPSPMDTMGYGQQAAGKHPTGMHSCLALIPFYESLLIYHQELFHKETKRYTPR